MKRNFKLLIVLLLTVATIFSIAACGKDSDKDNERTKVVVGVIGETNEMWVPVIETMKEEGVDIELKVFTDYPIPNQVLNDGDVDLNAFQHHAYLNAEIENKGYKITSIGNTFISSMNIYSDKIGSIDEIKEGDKIAIPNDATNGGRALKVLQAAGLIKVDPNAGDSPTRNDITENNLNLELVEVDAANVYSVLPDVAAGVINCNYALDNKLNPGEDSIFQDDVSFYTGNNYVNLIAARTEDADNPVYKRIVEVYQSDAVKEIYATTYKGSYKAAW